MRPRPRRDLIYVVDFPPNLITGHHGGTCEDVDFGQPLNVQAEQAQLQSGGDKPFSELQRRPCRQQSLVPLFCTRLALLTCHRSHTRLPA